MTNKIEMIIISSQNLIYDGIKIYPTSISNKVVTFAIPDITNDVYYLGANFHFTASYTEWEWDWNEQDWYERTHTNNYRASLGLNMHNYRMCFLMQIMNNCSDYL